jgi:hypothetical protein
MNCLAYPADFFYDKDEGNIYLVETFRNRIIRLVQNPEDVFHSSVFYQFNGRVGPTSITMLINDDMESFLFVARFEYQVLLYLIN